VRRRAYTAVLLTYFAACAASAQFVDSMIQFDAPVSAYLDFPQSDGNGDRIFVTGRTEDETNLAAVYRFDANHSLEPEPLVRTAVPSGLMFFDEGMLGDEPALLFAGPEGISRFDPRSGDIRLLFPFTSIYRTASNMALQSFEFFVDVNGDGLDDIVLPDFDGLRVSLQNAAGFGESQLLQIPARSRSSAGTSTYEADELHRYDFNGDDRQDIAVIRDGEFQVFYALADGGFTSAPAPIPSGLDVGEDSQAEAMQTLLSSDQSDTTISSISMVRDLNQDRLPDIVTYTVTSSGLFDKTSEYRVYFGSRDSERLRYGPQQNARILSSGFQIGVSPVDSIPHNAAGVATFSVDFGLRQFLAAIFTRSFSLDVALHRVARYELDDTEPAFASSVKISVDISTGSIRIPAMRFADFDGNGIVDFLSQSDEGELSVLLSATDQFDASRGTREWQTTLPSDGTRVTTRDLTGDQRHDVIVTYGNGDSDELQRTLRVLVSTM
jgi:hypothetical protein